MATYQQDAFQARLERLSAKQDIAVAQQETQPPARTRSDPGERPFPVDNLLEALVVATSYLVALAVLSRVVPPGASDMIYLNWSMMVFIAGALLAGAIVKLSKLEAEGAMPQFVAVIFLTEFATESFVVAQPTLGALLFTEPFVQITTLLTHAGERASALAFVLGV